MIRGSKFKKSVPSLAVEFDREEDGRWIAEVPKLPGVMAYGSTKQEAQRKVFAIALRTLADNLEQGSRLTPVSQLFVHGVASR
ncbi:MAG: type II toxin-antitoxin system HicB family antitoxin [bacterium]|nr:type II toxin-antitoxin system HicB family antitoxin [bacterium]